MDYKVVVKYLKWTQYIRLGQVESPGVLYLMNNSLHNVYFLINNTLPFKVSIACNLVDYISIHLTILYKKKLAKHV